MATQDDNHVGFWLGYATVAGLFYGLWHLNLFAGLFMALLLWPTLVCFAEVSRCLEK